MTGRLKYVIACLTAMRLVDRVRKEVRQELKKKQNRMIRVIKIDLSDFRKSGGRCGYSAEILEINIDQSLSEAEQKLTTIHEVLEARLGCSLPHNFYDTLAQDILEALEQIQTCSPLSLLIEGEGVFFYFSELEADTPSNKLLSTLLNGCKSINWI